MKLYYVDPPIDENAADGEDNREWFASKAAATKCFNEWVRLLKKDPNDYKIPRVYLSMVLTAKLPMRALLLAALNRKGYVESRARLREWEPKQ